MRLTLGRSPRRGLRLPDRKTPPATEQPAPAAPGGQGEPSTQDVLYDLPEQDEGDRFVDYGEVDLSDGEAQQIGEAFVAAGVGHTLAGD
jgi:hypothetical protein